MKISLGKLKRIIKESILTEVSWPKYTQEIHWAKPITWPEYKITTPGNMSLGGLEDETWVFNKIFGHRYNKQGYSVNKTDRGFRDKGDTFYVSSPTDLKVILKNAKKFSNDLTIEPSPRMGGWR